MSKTMTSLEGFAQQVAEEDRLVLARVLQISHGLYFDPLVLFRSQT